MLFNSYIFIFLFLPVTLLGYFGINKIDHKWGKLFLVMMSFVFYGYFNPYYLLIILGSIGVNYAIYKYVEKNTAVGTRKIALLAGLIFNIGLIFYYKYYDFFISNVNVVLGTDFNLLHILLPLGISFFTFQQVSFVVDAYYGRVGNITLLDYSLFVTFFPQLIAGPIVLHSEMLPQFAEEKNKYFNAENLVKGIMIFTMGLFKKIIIADTLGDFVGVGFANVRFMGSLDWLLIMFCYTFQIYFDFSGYSDMAIGLARMFNINLPLNFNSPYKALDIIEFWQRWHMTLTRFLRTYIYFPLGGNRKGLARTCLNIMVVFFLSGVWHGANWTFIIWGLMHGAMSVITRLVQKQWQCMPKVLQWVLTFSFVNVAWLLFRCDNLQQFCSIIANIFTANTWSLSETFIRRNAYLPELQFLNQCITGANINKAYLGHYLGILLLLCTLICVFCKNAQEFKYELTWKNLLLTVFLLVYSVISLSKAATFLYFNF